MKKEIIILTLFKLPSAFINHHHLCSRSLVYSVFFIIAGFTDVTVQFLSAGGHQRTSGALLQSRTSVFSVPSDPVSRTNWKQLRTDGSMLEPPKDATSPSCRGIWMESWRRRPRRRWSQKPVVLATCLNKTGGRRAGRTGQKKQTDMSSALSLLENVHDVPVDPIK